MPIRFFVTAAFALAASFPLAACREGPATEPTEPSRRAAAVHAARGRAADPRAQAVLAAMEGYKQAILDSDTAALARTWTDTLHQSAGRDRLAGERLANIGQARHRRAGHRRRARDHGTAVRGHGGGAEPLDSAWEFRWGADGYDLRGSFVWVRRGEGGSW